MKLFVCMWGLTDSFKKLAIITPTDVPESNPTKIRVRCFSIYCGIDVKTEKAKTVNTTSNKADPLTRRLPIRIVEKIVPDIAPVIA